MGSLTAAAPSVLERYAAVETIVIAGQIFLRYHWLVVCQFVLTLRFDVSVLDSAEAVSVSSNRHRAILCRLCKRREQRQGQHSIAEHSRSLACPFATAAIWGAISSTGIHLGYNILLYNTVINCASVGGCNYLCFLLPSLPRPHLLESTMLLLWTWTCLQSIIIYSY